MGNTWGRGDGKWMQNNINALWVKPDGTCYTNSFWDEGGNESGIYRNGDVIGSLAFSHDRFEGGNAVTGDESFVYANNWLQVKRFHFDGTYADSTLNVTSRAWPTDKSLTIKGLAVDKISHRLFVSQNFDNEIQAYSTVNFAKTASWPLDRPGPCAASGDGTVWVVQMKDAASVGAVLHYTASGQLLSQRISGPSGFDPQALSFDRRGRLMVADNGPDQTVKLYSDLANAAPTLQATFGNGIFTGSPGAVTTTKFGSSGLTGVGEDSSGSVYVSLNGVGSQAYWNGGGSVLEAWSSSGAFRWRLMGLEFVDCGDFDPLTDGQDVFSKYTHYRLDLTKTAPGSEWSYTGHTLNQIRYPNDPRFSRANDSWDYTGGTFVRVINGKKFLYVLDMQARRMFVYRFNQSTDGEVAIPCALFEHNFAYTQTYPNSPSGGEFIWIDANGNGGFDQGEFESGPGLPNQSYGWFVDDSGDVWQCNHWAGTGVGIRRFRLQGVGGTGVPRWTYTAMDLIQRPVECRGDLKRIEYLPALDQMYITSRSEMTDRDAGTSIARFDHWSNGNPVATWDTTFIDGPAEAISIAGDYIFVGYSYFGDDARSGMIRIHRKSDFGLVGALHAGPEIGSIEGTMDIGYGVRAFRRSNGEYLILSEDDWYAKLILYRWRPENDTLTTDNLARNPGNELDKGPTQSSAARTQRRWVIYNLKGARIGYVAGRNLPYRGRSGIVLMCKESTTSGPASMVLLRDRPGR